MTVLLPRTRAVKTATLPAAFVSSLLTGLLLLFALAGAARAQVTVSLTPANQSGAAGGSVTYSATIQNFSSSAIYLQGLSFSIDPTSASYITATDDPFFNNVPFELDAGSTYSGQYFGLNIASNTPAGNYTGAVSLIGGTNSDGSNAGVLDSPQNFLVSVSSSSTPEPGSFALALPCLIGSVSVVSRRRRTKRAA